MTFTDSAVTGVPGRGHPGQADRDSDSDSEQPELGEDGKEAPQAHLMPGDDHGPGAQAQSRRFKIMIMILVWMRREPASRSLKHCR